MNKQYTTIQLWTIPVPTIQILWKISKGHNLERNVYLYKEKTYLDLTTAYKPFFSFLKNFRYIFGYGLVLRYR